MESDTYFLPSEIARLVLGYLKENNYTLTYKSFLKECPHLKEYSLMMKQGRHFPLTIMGISLVTMVQEYADLKLKANKEGQWSQPIAGLWKEYETVVRALKQATKIKARQINGDLQNARTRRATKRLQLSQSEYTEVQSPKDLSVCKHQTASNKSSPTRNGKDTVSHQEKTQADFVAELSSDDGSLPPDGKLTRGDGANINGLLDECGDEDEHDKGESGAVETHSDHGIQTAVTQNEIAQPGVALSTCTSSEQNHVERRAADYHLSPVSQRDTESPRLFMTQVSSPSVIPSQTNTSVLLPNSSVNLFSTSTTCFPSLTLITVDPTTPQKNSSFQQELPWSPNVKSPRRKRHPPKKRPGASHPSITQPAVSVSGGHETHTLDTQDNPNTSLAVPELFEKILNDTKLHEKLAETINERFLEVKSSQVASHTQQSAAVRRTAESVLLTAISEDTIDRILNKPLSISEENIIDGIIQITTSDPVFDTLFKTFDAVDTSSMRLPGDVPTSDACCASTSTECFEPAVSTLRTSAPSPCTSTLSSESQDQMLIRKPRRIKPTPCGPPVSGKSLDSSHSPWSALRPVASPAFAQASEQIAGSVRGGQTVTVVQSLVHGATGATDCSNSGAPAGHDAVNSSQANTAMTRHVEQSQYSDPAVSRESTARTQQVEQCSNPSVSNHSTTAEYVEQSQYSNCVMSNQNNVPTQQVELSQYCNQNNVLTQQVEQSQYCNQNNVLTQQGEQSQYCNPNMSNQNNLQTHQGEQANYFNPNLSNLDIPQPSISLANNCLEQIATSSAIYQLGSNGQLSNVGSEHVSFSPRILTSSTSDFPVSAGCIHPSASSGFQIGSDGQQSNEYTVASMSSGPSVQNSVNPCVQTSAASGVGEAVSSVQNYCSPGAGSEQNGIASSSSCTNGNPHYVSLPTSSHTDSSVMVSETVVQSGFESVSRSQYQFGVDDGNASSNSRGTPVTTTCPIQGGMTVSDSTSPIGVAGDAALYETGSVDGVVCYQPVGTRSVSYGPNTTQLSSPASPSGSFLNQSVLPVVFSPSNSSLPPSSVPANSVSSLTDSLQTVTCLPDSILCGTITPENLEFLNVKTKKQKRPRKPRQKNTKSPKPKRKNTQKKSTKAHTDMPVIDSAVCSSVPNVSMNSSVQSTTAITVDSGSGLNVISVSTPQKSDNGVFDICQLLTLSPGGQTWQLKENCKLSSEPMVVMTATETPTKLNLSTLPNVEHTHSSLIYQQSPRANQNIVLASVINSPSGSSYPMLTSPANTPFRWPNILSKSGKKTPLHSQIPSAVNEGYFVNPKLTNAGTPTPASPYETFKAVPICKKSELISKDCHVRSLSFESGIPVTKISPSALGSLVKPVNSVNLTGANPVSNRARTSSRLGTVCIRTLNYGGESVPTVENTKKKTKSHAKGVTMLKPMPLKNQNKVSSRPILELTVTSPSGKKSTVMNFLDDRTGGDVKLTQPKGSEMPSKTVQEKKKNSAGKLPIPPLKRPSRKPCPIRPKPVAAAVPKKESCQKQKSSSAKQTNSGVPSRPTLLQPLTSRSGAARQFTKLQPKAQTVISNLSCNVMMTPSSTGHSVLLNAPVSGNQEEEAAWTLASFSSSNILADAMKEANISMEDALSLSGMEDRVAASSSQSEATGSDVPQHCPPGSQPRAFASVTSMQQSGPSTSKTQNTTPDDDMEKRHSEKIKPQAVVSVASTGGSASTSSAACLRSLSPVVCLERTEMPPGRCVVTVKENTADFKTARSIANNTLKDPPAVMAVHKPVCSTASSTKSVSVKPINQPLTCVGRMKTSVSNRVCLVSDSEHSASNDQTSETGLSKVMNTKAFEKQKVPQTVISKSASPVGNVNQKTLETQVANTESKSCSDMEYRSSISSSNQESISSSDQMNPGDSLKEKMSGITSLKPMSPVCVTSDKTDTNSSISKSSSQIDSLKFPKDSSNETDKDASISGEFAKTLNNNILKLASSQLSTKKTKNPKSTNSKCVVAKQTSEVRFPASPHGDGAVKATGSATSTPMSKRKHKLVEYSTDEGSLDSIGSCGRKKRKLNIKTASVDKLLSILHTL